MQHGVLPRLEKDLTELQGLEKNKLLSDVVTSDDIAAVISRWTGVPVAKLVSTEKREIIVFYTIT